MCQCKTIFPLEPRTLLLDMIVLVNTVLAPEVDGLHPLTYGWGRLLVQGEFSDRFSPASRVYKTIAS